MKTVDTYLDIVQEDLTEGKIWDATKKLWKDHKGKIIAGTAAVAAGAAVYGGKKKYDKNKNDKDAQDNPAQVMPAGERQASSKQATEIRDAKIKKNIKNFDFKERKKSDSDAMAKSVEAGKKQEIYNKYHPTTTGQKIAKGFKKWRKNSKEAAARIKANG